MVTGSSPVGDNMSHRYFKCDGIDIICGYDVRKSHYYMIVSYKDEVLFSTEQLIDPAVSVRDLMRFAKRFKIKAPGSFFFDLAMDEELLRDDLIKDYRVDIKTDLYDEVQSRAET